MVTDTNKGMIMCCCHCDYYEHKCTRCQEEQDRAYEHKVCESWNWNCSPRECAEDAKEKGWSKSQIIHAMATFGFKKPEINQVVYEFESL